MCVWESKTTEVKYHSHSVISRVQASNLTFITVDVSLYHLAGIVFVRFLPYKVTLFSPFIGLYALESGHCTVYTFKEWEVMFYLLEGAASV